MGCEMLWKRQAEDQGLSILQSSFPLYLATRSGAQAARGIGFISSKQIGTIPFVKNGRVFLTQRCGGRADLTHVIASERSERGNLQPAKVNGRGAKREVATPLGKPSGGSQRHDGLATTHLAHVIASERSERGNFQLAKVNGRGAGREVAASSREITHLARNYPNPVV